MRASSLSLALPSEESPSKMQQTKSVIILHCFHLKMSYISVKQEQAEGTSPTISNYGRKSKDISPSAIHQLQNLYISGGFHSSGYVLALCWWVGWTSMNQTTHSYIQAGTDRGVKKKWGFGVFFFGGGGGFFLFFRGEKEMQPFMVK